MYKNLGIQWASSVPAFLSLACVPLPFLFYKFGPTIRLHSRYAAKAKLVTETMLNKPKQTPMDTSPSTTPRLQAEGLEADEAAMKKLDNE